MSIKLEKFLKQSLNKCWPISDVPGIGDRLREQLYHANLTKVFQLYEIFKRHQTYESFNQAMMREHQVSLPKATFNALCMVREESKSDSDESIESYSAVQTDEDDDDEYDDDIVCLDDNADKEQLQQLNNEAVFPIIEEPQEEHIENKNELHIIPKTSCLKQGRIDQMKHSKTEKSSTSRKQVRFNTANVRKLISHHNTRAPTQKATTTTMKYRYFVDEPLGDKDIQSIPSIGPITANFLKEMDITKAYQLLGLYMGQDNQKFTNLMIKKCFLKNHNIRKCIEALQGKCEMI